MSKSNLAEDVPRSEQPFTLSREDLTLSGRSRSSLPPANILLVEDDDSLRNLVAQNLEKRGYRVRQARSGAEVLAAVAQERPDLLVLDIELPDLTGWEILRRLPAEQRDDLMVLVLSGVRMSPKRVAEFQPVACLPKPFPLDALLRAIDKHVAHGRPGE